jgi:hypothetical protein
MMAIPASTVPPIIQRRIAILNIVEAPEVFGRSTIAIAERDALI